VRVGLFSLEKRRLWGHLVVVCHYLKGTYKKAGEELFRRACNDKTRDNGFNLEEGRFRLDRRKKFFEGDGTLEQVAQTSCGCALPASFQVGGFEQPGLVENIPEEWCLN